MSASYPCGCALTGGWTCPTHGAVLCPCCGVAVEQCMKRTAGSNTIRAIDEPLDAPQSPPDNDWRIVAKQLASRYRFNPTSRNVVALINELERLADGS